MSIRFIRRKFILLGFAFCLSCNVGASSERISGVSYDPTPTPPTSTTRTLIEASPELISRTAYSMILTQLVPVDSVMLVGDKTIAPSTFEALGEFPSLTSDTIEDFKKKNSARERVEDHFDVYASIELTPSENDVATTLKALKTRRPRAEGLILFSGIGSSRDRSQHLVYTEFYTSEGSQVQKRFYLLLFDEKNNELQMVRTNPL